MTFTLYRLFTLGLFVLLPTIIQPVLSLPVQGPSLSRRTSPAHPITEKKDSGHTHDPFIMAALHAPLDASHAQHTTFSASIPKSAGNAHPEEVHHDAGDRTFTHAETHALALAHADGRGPGAGSYTADHANSGAGPLNSCRDPHPCSSSASDPHCVEASHPHMNQGCSRTCEMCK